jgi:hypothetical protein
MCLPEIDKDNCKISSLLKSNSKISPLFEFFAKSVHFVMKVDRICNKSGLILQKNSKSGSISELGYKSELVLQMPQIDIMYVTFTSLLL